MSRPFAVFDIDGTIIRWQLYHAVVDALGRAGHIRPEHYQALKETRMVWKRRTNESSFASMSGRWYGYMMKRLLSLHTKTL